MTIDLSLPLDVSVPSGGYAWWYVDVIGDDSPYAATVIFFRGNPFSPFYLRALAKGEALADDFCAVNVVLYRGRRKLWTFTEFVREATHHGSDQLAIGENTFSLDGDGVTLRFSTRSPLIGAKLRGTVKLEPSALFDVTHGLDGAKKHAWFPMAPISRATVTLEEPKLSFSGEAYFDGNRGCEPLGAGFDRWHWMRGPAADKKGSSIIYDAKDRGGNWTRFSRVFRPDGQSEVIALDNDQRLPRSRWLLERTTRVASDERAWLDRTLESAPFYARSVVSIRDGKDRERLAMHEVMDVSRFRRRLIQAAFYLRMLKQKSAGARPRLGLWARLRS